MERGRLEAGEGDPAQLQIRSAALQRRCPPSGTPSPGFARPASAAWCTRAEWTPQAQLPGRGWGGSGGRAGAGPSGGTRGGAGPSVGGGAGRRARAGPRTGLLQGRVSGAGLSDSPPAGLRPPEWAGGLAFPTKTLGGPHNLFPDPPVILLKPSLVSGAILSQRAPPALRGNKPFQLLTVSCVSVLFWYFLPAPRTCGILVPPPGIEPSPPAVEVRSLINCPTTREFPPLVLI